MNYKLNDDDDDERDTLQKENNLLSSQNSAIYIIYIHIPQWLTLADQEDWPIASLLVWLGSETH